MQKSNSTVYIAHFTHRSVGSSGAKCPFCVKKITGSEVNTEMLYFVTGLNTSIRQSRFAHISCAVDFAVKMIHHKETELCKIEDHITRGKGCVICRNKVEGPFARIALRGNTSLRICSLCLYQVAIQDKAVYQKRSETRKAEVQQKREQAAKKQQLVGKIKRLSRAYGVRLRLNKTFVRIIAGEHSLHDIPYRKLRIKLPFVSANGTLVWPKSVRQMCEVTESFFIEGLKDYFATIDRKDFELRSATNALCDELRKHFRVTVQDVHLIYSKALCVGGRAAPKRVRCAGKHISFETIYRANPDLHTLLLVSYNEDVRTAVLFRQEMNEFLATDPEGLELPRGHAFIQRSEIHEFLK